MGKTKSVTSYTSCHPSNCPQRCPLDHGNETESEIPIVSLSMRKSPSVEGILIQRAPYAYVSPTFIGWRSGDGQSSVGLDGSCWRLLRS